MNIAICDDNETDAMILKKSICELSKKYLKNWHSEIFLNGQDLIRAINNFEVVLLDMEMPRMDGFETGQIIKKYNPECIIIMETAKLEHANDACKLGASRYLVKPIQSAALLESLSFAESVVTTDSTNSDVIDVYHGRKHFHINLDSVIKIEANHGVCDIFTKTEIFKKNVALKELEILLNPSCFVRTNKYQLVNLKYVSNYLKGTFTIMDEKIIVSRNHIKEFETAWINYGLQ